jgi:hypothetical protein
MSELEKIKVEAGQNEGAEPMTDEQAKKPKLKLAPVTVGDRRLPPRWQSISFTEYAAALAELKVLWVSP